MNALKLNLVAMVWLVLTSVCSAGKFEVGNFVFPKNTPAVLKVGNQITAKVAVDDFLIVLDRQGDWLWVECRDLQSTDDEGPKGWVRLSEVDDIDEQIKYWNDDTTAKQSIKPLDYYFLGLICRLSDEPYYLKEAVSYFTRAIQLAPADETYYQMRGYCWSKLDQPQQALVDFQMALSLDPGNEMYQNAVSLYRDLAQAKLDEQAPAPAPPAPADAVTSTSFDPAI